MERETKLLILTTALGGLIYFLLLLAEMPWIGLLVLLLVSSVYLYFLHHSFKKQSESKRVVQATGIVLILIVLIQFASFGFNYSRKDVQLDFLMDIRGTIDRGVMRAFVEKDLMNVFQEYHLEDRDSILAVADRELGYRMLGNGTYDLTIDKQNPIENDFLYGSYKKNKEQDELIVTVVSEISPGKDPDYNNSNGDTGMQELVFTLNSEGVDYENRN